MKFNLQDTLKSLGLPVALVAIFGGVLSLFGIELDVILGIAYSMVGAYAVISFVVNVLKWAGVVPDGSAGKWSAALNLVAVVAISVVYGFYPTFDFASLDAKLFEFMSMVAMALAWTIQVIGSKWFHYFMVDVLGIGFFSNPDLSDKLKELEEVVNP